MIGRATHRTSDRADDSVRGGVVLHTHAESGTPLFGSAQVHVHRLDTEPPRAERIR
jgi:hypothetical protein